MTLCNIQNRSSSFFLGLGNVAGFIQPNVLIQKVLIQELVYPLIFLPSGLYAEAQPRSSKPRRSDTILCLVLTKSFSNCDFFKEFGDIYYYS